MHMFNFSATGASYKIGGHGDHGTNYYYQHAQNNTSFTKKVKTQINSSSNQKDLSHPDYDV
mgnify:CR=1 FL=1